jgi:thiol:disulfide interchange protein
MPPADPRAISGPTRALPRGLAIAALVLAAARLLAAVWGGEPGARGGAGAAEERVPWVPFEQAVARARAEGKPILYDFTADWCPPCQAMKRELFADPEAAQTIARAVVPVRVLDRQREAGRNPPVVDSLQRAYQIEAFPTLVVAWPGSPQHATARGYRGKDLTLAWLVSSAATVGARAREPEPPRP